MVEGRHEEDRTAAVLILKPGAMVAQYKIERQLGVGGMGEVFLADDTRLKRKVALKFLAPNLATDESLKARFMREAQSAAALNHPNIVTVFEVSEYGQRVFIAMEFVEGKSLREIIDDHELSLEKAVHIAVQVCEGLQAAHKIGMVHRDIKPLNIIIDPTDRVRILDFGLAKATGDEQLTQAGMALGTVHYMSPEQGQGDEADHRSDIFSMGIVLYEMLTGQLPFKKGNIPATIHAIVHDEPPSLKSHNPDLPPALQDIINHVLAKQPDTRYQLIGDLASDLRQVLVGGHTQLSTTAVPSAPAMSARSLAVLHLQNLGPPDDEFLSYGITEDLIVDLTRIGTIRVSPMRSVMKFKDSDADLEDIAAKLKVNLILDGSIHKSQSAIRISAQLVDVASGNNLWAERWEEPPENLPRIKRALAEGVSHALDVGTTVVRRAEVGVPEAEDAQAYELYLKAKYLFDRKKEKADVDIALGLYRQALREEPSLLAARAGIGEILTHQGEYDEAQQELESGLKESESKQLVAEQANFLQLLARLYVMQSQWDEASDHAQKALKLVREVGDLAGEAEAIGVLISALQPQGKFDEALQLFDRVLEISRKLDDEEKIAEALKSMGVAYSRKGDYLRAQGLYEEALEIAREQENLSLQAACLSNIGNVYYFQGDLDMALRFYGQALEINSRLGDRAGSARQNLNMGLVQLQRGNQREGLDLLHTSASFFEAMGDQSNFALTLCNISEINLVLGEFEDSLDAAKKALNIAKRISHPLSELSANHHLGSIYLYNRDFDKASKHLQAALKIANANNMSRNIAGLQADTAKLHYLKGEPDLSTRHAKRAQTIAREIGDKPILSIASAYLAALSTHEGLYNAGIRQLRQQQRIAKEISDPQLNMHISILLGDVLYGSEREEDRSEGRQLLEKTREEAETLQLAPEIKWITEILEKSRD
jgi:serine/threonine protein kinase/tetratricopeptide (TPR) repeat protein